MTATGLSIEADKITAFNPDTGAKAEVSHEEAARRILTGPGLVEALEEIMSMCEFPFSQESISGKAHAALAAAKGE